MKSMSPKPSYGSKTVTHSRPTTFGSTASARMPNVPNVPKMSMGKQGCMTGNCPGSKRK
jgi:hypothetical protein